MHQEFCWLWYGCVDDCEPITTECHYDGGGRHTVVFESGTYCHPRSSGAFTFRLAPHVAQHTAQHTGDGDSPL